ncbi:MAG TPA: hypothetical protein VG406_07635 [Isosphaeraceae bacterium]|nr:hypothetical protein [Isosphaeraceae bacterium]
MASYKFDPKTGRARIFFRLGGIQHNKRLKLGNQREAARLAAQVEQTHVDLELGRLTLPEGADVLAFVVSGGKVVERPEPVSTAFPGAASPKGPVTIGDLFEAYRADPPPNLQESTRKMTEIHFRRILEVCPKATVPEFDKAAVQSYVRERAKAKYRGKPIHRDTIAKELKTLRRAWVAERCPDVPPAPFTLRELTFPKAVQKPAFMTWSEIEREIGRGGLKEREIEDLWIVSGSTRDRSASSSGSYGSRATRIGCIRWRASQRSPGRGARNSAAVGSRTGGSTTGW